MDPDLFLALDVETANADRASICQLGIAGFNGRRLVTEWKSLVDPQDEFDPFNVSVHGIDVEAVRGAPTFEQLAANLRELLTGAVVVCHTHFDRGAITRAFAKVGQAEPDCAWLDSAMVARRTWPDVARGGYGLQDLCTRIGYSYQAHDALEDAKAAAVVLLAALDESGMGLEAWRQRLEEARHCAHAKVTAEGNPNGPIRGEVLVFTGTLSLSRRDAAEMAASIGCAVAAGVTRNTTMLIVGDLEARLPNLQGGKSSKQKKAEQLRAAGQHIDILSETDFVELVRQNSGGE
jgi:DNA polymerase-3 subunit epsilon